MSEGCVQPMGSQLITMASHIPAQPSHPSCARGCEQPHDSDCTYPRVTQSSGWGHCAMPPGGRRWTWRGAKDRCHWLGHREGCRTSYNTGSTGSEGSRGRQGSPGKGEHIQVVSRGGDVWPGCTPACPFTLSPPLERIPCPQGRHCLHCSFPEADSEIRIQG